MAELDHTIVSIRFSGKDLDIQKISELLGYMESESTRSTFKKVKGGDVVWSIQLKNDDTLDLEKKIVTLLAKFTPEINKWKLETYNIKADIFCGLFLDGWNQGFSLSSILMKEISDRDLKIGFDIYSATDSWDKLIIY
jgi:hypothetical protein